jgi:hypothetical protein
MIEGLPAISRPPPVYFTDAAAAALRRSMAGFDADADFVASPI